MAYRNTMWHNVAITYDLKKINKKKESFFVFVCGNSNSLHDHYTILLRPKRNNNTVLYINLKF